MTTITKREPCLNELQFRRTELLRALVLSGNSPEREQIEEELYEVRNQIDTLIGKDLQGLFKKKDE